jgi:hypothetical protein
MPLPISPHILLEGSVSLLPSLYALSEFSSKRKLAKLDVKEFEIKRVKVHPRKYNGKIVFELLTLARRWWSIPLPYN